MTEQTFTIPLADTGDGGVLAEIVVTDRELSHTALLSLAEVLGRSAAPITLSFKVDRPPPLLVDSDDAAKALGVTASYVDKLVREGILPAVEWNDAPKGGRNHINRAIPWEALVALAEQAKATGELPLINREMADRPKGLRITDLLLEVMREAYHAGEEPLSMHDMQTRVSQRMWDRYPQTAGAEVPWKSVQSAQGTWVRKGLIERISLGYRPGKQGPVYRYKYRPEIEPLVHNRGKLMADRVERERLERNAKRKAAKVSDSAG